MAHRLNSPEVTAFQQVQLARLRRMTFHEICSLPLRERLAKPAHIRGISFRIERSPGVRGGVRIEVLACSRFLLIFEGCRCPGFEVLPDGTILEDVDEPPED